ncbi:MAG: pantoate--beta-alanine ligase [Actinomycetota bacterium]
MEVIRTVAELRTACDRVRRAKEPIGFVPTMGGLHEGHASLLRRARDEAAVVVMSLFVNPLQFDDASDLERYPRDERHDLRAAEREGVDFVFVPPVEELFPGGEPEVTVDPGPLGERFEGAARPGHFRGVATVVVVLLDIVGACTVYFGEKDVQQLAIVRRVVRDLLLPASIVGCPTVREHDGLARSSRNALLDPEQRDAAGCLFLGLSEAAELARSGETDAAVLVAVIAREVGATSAVRLDQAVIVDEETFEQVRTLEPDRAHRALVAAQVGEVRLIDNLLLPSPA